MPHLFEEWKVKSVTLRNRIGVSPMCQYSAEDGFINDWHLVHLGSRAVGGAGLVIMEATGVEARGRISPGCTGLWSDEHIAPLQRLTRFIKAQGAVPGIQLAHAGRKASREVPWNGDRPAEIGKGGWEVIAPSAIAFDAGWQVPREMTRETIREVQNAFRESARRAVDAGFEWVELHGAHGYLINEFLSPLSNTRTDEYGGTLENRARFMLETVREMKKAWPADKPFAVRLSATDWAPGGLTIEDTVQIAKWLKAEGVDLVDCSSGGLLPRVSIPVGAGYQVNFAERVRREAGIATAAVGLITDAAQADETVRNGRADLVLLARELLRDPYWPLHAAPKVHAKSGVAVPRQYGRAF